MIAIEKTHEGRVSDVSGDRAELMLFFCLWQTFLWPTWMKGTSHYIGTKEMHTNAIRLIRDEATLKLSDDGKLFEDATQQAIDICQSLGVEVRT